MTDQSGYSTGANNGAVLFHLIRKELVLLCLSPVAALIALAFIGASLFSFFWLEAFFARNIVDVRPLFSAMPLLLMLLSSALTMRLWSDEKRQGSLHALLAYGHPTRILVLGKFLACTLFVSGVLLLTLPVPLAVSAFAALDWAVVACGYLAVFLLACCFLSAGVFFSACSANAIVSFLLSFVFSMVFYFAASSQILQLLDAGLIALVRQFSAMLHFETLLNGVLSLQDILYFLSIIFVFLVLNVFVVERGRWSRPGNTLYHNGVRILTLLLIGNVLCANFLLAKWQPMRLDLTADKHYSLGTATKKYLGQIDAPLLIRAYLSKKSHPMLMPIKDELTALLSEYAHVGNRYLEVEIVDPRDDPYQEMEAVSKYGIQSTPFQVNDRFQASYINAYFHVLVQYGDQFEVLDAKNLIDMKLINETEMEIGLRNPEYAITSAIKKVISRFRQSADFLSGLDQPLLFTGYFSADNALPADYRAYKNTLLEVLAEMQKISGGRFIARFADPDNNKGQVAEKLVKGFGFQPYKEKNTGKPFWFSMTLRSGDKAIPMLLPQPFTTDSFRQAIERGARQFVPASQKTLLLVYPPFNRHHHEFTSLEEQLGQVMKVRITDLLDESYQQNADILLLVSPEQLNEE
ncbi:MAG: Gldg family protein, partial [Pseudomonadales bacterium]|nr:Gldg family protein [Pseudomonadales bacterium]